MLLLLIMAASSSRDLLSLILSELPQKRHQSVEYSEKIGFFHRKFKEISRNFHK